jgi:hypothetical protein
LDWGGEIGGVFAGRIDSVAENPMGFQPSVADDNGGPVLAGLWAGWVTIQHLVRRYFVVRSFNDDSVRIPVGQGCSSCALLAHIRKYEHLFILTGDCLL